jgi:anhydro-N-acetylmuramic acid kinase
MPPNLFAGVMSGTSLDGVDAALVWLPPSGSPSLRGSHYLAYPEDVREQLRALYEPGPNELHRSALLGNRLAQLYAAAILDLLRSTGTEAAKVAAIGCHGQTVRHQPHAGYTIQIGNPALLAELTGITSIADFRSRDIAAGGQGAPLVPAFHAAVFRDPSRHRVILNLGGIANLTDLAPGNETRGFDCGPANMLLDAWIRRHRGKPYDDSGNWSLSGRVLQDLLDRLRSHSFFAAPPPKSCGHEEFNLAWLDQHLTGSESPPDVQATLAALTAGTIADAVKNWCGAVEELYACGGGAHNTALMSSLAARLPKTRVATTTALGVAPDWIEAMAFAWLAQRVLLGQPGNLSAVTGARGPRLLGAIYPA